MLFNADCLDVLPDLEDCADLIFADPPFNIGYKYSGYKDSRADYVQWCEKWIGMCYRCLKAGGAFWVAIGDEYAAELVVASKSAGFNMRNWVVWHYKFGTYCKKKFGRCHTHLLYFIKGKKANVFDPPRVESIRQQIGDKRASGAKIPGDVWEVSRVCGTFNERVGWHPCQMPESILERIILTSSVENDLIIDPFSGSGTTLVVASRLNRRWHGIEQSLEYCRGIRNRLCQQDVN